jgi:peptidoglycan/LPS O-acetylase OafA/YrhL
MQTYRPDIDGLRAIAVVSVVLFHASMPGFGGGFLGVDVFFVISGFLITRILTHEGTQAVSLAAFYERRVRRIAPALIAVLAASLLAALLLFSPNEIEELSKTVVSVTFFVANFHFMRGADYFASQADASPLVHLWSLSVEEQFYVAYPLFLWVMRRLPRTFLLPAVAAGLVASFAVSQWLATRDPNAAFYFTPSRAWEILLGALVALRPLKVPEAGAEVLALVSLSLVTVPVFFFSRHTVWPGLNAAIPTAGTAVLLALGEGRRTLVSRLLSLKPLVAVGLVSYSLYLWHWPLFEFYQRWVLRPIAPWEYAVLIAIAASAAWLSWRFVERPFRRVHNGIDRTVLLCGVAASALTLVCGCTAVLAAKGLPERFDPPTRRIYAYMDIHGDARFIREMGLRTCSINEFTDTKPFPFETCLSTTQGRRNILLWGDSHSRNYLVGLRHEAKNADVDVLQATFHSCVPALANPRATPACTAFNRSLFDHLDHRIAAVILSARLTGQTHSAVAMRDMARQIVRKGIRVIVIGPSLEYRQPVPLYVARYVSTGDPSMLDTAPRLIPGLGALDATVGSLFAHEPGVTYISVLDTVCHDYRCPLVTGTAPVQFDEAHLTLEGSLLLGTALWPQIADVLGKPR